MYPNKKWVNISDWYGKRQWNKYLQVYTHLDSVNVHYEYMNEYVYLHLEGEYASKEYLHKVRELKRRSQSHTDEIAWLAPDSNCVGCMYREPVCGVDDLIGKFRRMTEIFENDVVEVFGCHKALPSLCERYDCDAREEEILAYNDTDTVTIYNISIKDIVGLPLVIPSFQRIYCWENHQIESLWQCLKELGENTPYHLGNIILQEHNDSYEVVDGQQRLVTLSLMLWGLGYQDRISLLTQRFSDEEAVKHIENAKAVIDSLRHANRDELLLQKIVSSLMFTVLVIHGDNLDLGYTFFSNQNSKGVKLSDYDLLKAHHLRYISSEPQARHLAMNWAKLSQTKEGESLQVAQSLGKHVYRMRHLLRKEDLNEYGHYVRDEFQAAAIMPDVPPFGERFDYFEPIQGGAHFFAFVNQFNDRYKDFCHLPQVVELRDKFLPRHRVYEEMVETLLFGYYIKFNCQYLSEALFCILARLAEHRYDKVRAMEHQVRRYVNETNLIQLVQFSTSPTFFLASAFANIKTSILDYDIAGGIRWDYHKSICHLFAALDDITVEDIKRRIEYEYT